MSLSWVMYGMVFRQKKSEMSLSFAMYMQRRSVGIVLQDSIAAVAVRLIHIISMEVSWMHMISAVNCRRSESNARL